MNDLITSLIQGEFKLEGINADNVGQLGTLTEEFKRASRSAYIPWVVGAVDGLVVRVRKPHKTEADNPRAFWNRKVLR